jgi:hypothetical protein
MSLDEEERIREREQRAVEERRQTKRARADPPVATVIPQTLMAAYSEDEARKAALPKVCVFVNIVFTVLTAYYDRICSSTHSHLRQVPTSKTSNAKGCANYKVEKGLLPMRCALMKNPIPTLSLGHEKRS